MMGSSQQKEQSHHENHQQDHESNNKILYDLSSLVLNIMRYPPRSYDLIGDGSPPTVIHRRIRPGPSFQQITPAGFASLLLGMSLALMLCGSLTFFIGFMLLPWVLCLVVFLYFVGIVSGISMIGKAVFCPPPTSPRKDVPSRWKLL